MLNAADVVFPTLQGDYGEGGELQRVLQAQGKPYVGQTPELAQLIHDKPRCVLHQMVQENGRELKYVDLN